eukprot:jgi/Psemu1/291038/fgenesh1_pg.607_\
MEDTDSAMEDVTLQSVFPFFDLDMAYILYKIFNGHWDHTPAGLVLRKLHCLAWPAFLQLDPLDISTVTSNPMAYRDIWDFLSFVDHVCTETSLDHTDAHMYTEPFFYAFVGWKEQNTKKPFMRLSVFKCQYTIESLHEYIIEQRLVCDVSIIEQHLRDDYLGTPPHASYGSQADPPSFPSFDAATGHIL